MPDRIHVTKVPIVRVCSRNGCTDHAAHLIVSQSCGGEPGEKWTNIIGACEGHVEEAFAMAKAHAKGMVLRRPSAVLPS